MDYETVLVQKPCERTCWFDYQPNLGWDCGEITEVRLTLCGDILVGNTLISAEDFLKGSSTKYFKMALSNIKGEVVDEQIQYAKDFEYHHGKASCTYIVEGELSQKLRPGSYTLSVSLINTLPATEDLPERTILNMLLTEADGIEITIS